MDIIQLKINCPKYHYIKVIFTPKNVNHLQQRKYEGNRGTWKFDAT